MSCNNMKQYTCTFVIGFALSTLKERTAFQPFMCITQEGKKCNFLGLHFNTLFHLHVILMLAL